MQVLPAENYQLKSGANNEKGKQKKSKAKTEGTGKAKKENKARKKQRNKMPVHDMQIEETVDFCCRKVREHFFLLITANHCSVGVSQGPRLSFFSDW